MFDKSDPRNQLKSNVHASKNEQPKAFAGAEFEKFYESPPVQSDDSKRTWWMRGQNFFLSYSEVCEGAELIRTNQRDEYMIILPDKDSQITVTALNEETIVNGFSLVVVPSGNSNVKVTKGGRVIRLFSIANEDLKELPSNKESYEKHHPNVSDFKPWPNPPSGPKVRVYSLDVPKQEGRFGRIFRCSTFMVNFLEPKDGPRDPSKLSPHSHDDFEQCSLALEGEYIHHLRWPWIPDKTQWREDEHEICGSPSVAVMPARVIHTSEAIGPGINQLVDIFCPPRLDFSKQPGWVLNDDEYPMS